MKQGLRPRLAETVHPRPAPRRSKRAPGALRRRRQAAAELRHGLPLPLLVASKLVPGVPGYRQDRPLWLQPADLFACSRYGSDDNDGRSPLTPFKTLGRMQTAALAWGEGVRTAGLAGSEWWEEYDLSSLTDKTFRAYGKDIATAGFPCVRGDAVVEGPWNTAAEREDAYDKVYGVSWEFETDANQQAVPPHFYEGTTTRNVRLMRWVNSIAECQATPHSFYHDGDLTATSPVNAYIHPAGSTNPNSDGKVYSATKRNHAVKMGTGGAMSLIFTRNQGHDNGAANGEDDIDWTGCWATGSPIHDMLAASGRYKWCVFWHDYDDPRTGAIAGEFFRANGSGRTAEWYECYARGVPSGAVKGLGGHVMNPSDTTYYDSVSNIGCVIDNCDAYFKDTKIAITKRSMMIDGQWRWLSESATGSALLEDAFFLGLGERGAGVVSGSLANSRLTVRGLRAFGNVPFVNGILSGLYNADMQRCIIVTKTDAATTFMRSTHASAVYMGAKQCIFVYDGIGTAEFVRLTGVSHLPDNDNNIYSGWGGFTVNNGGTVTYKDFAEFKAATGVDPNSLAVNRSSLLDPNSITDAAFFIGAGWTLSSPGVWVQDGTGSTATARLQFNVAAGVYEVVFTITGPGTVDLRNGATVIASNLPAGTYVYRFAVAANINFAPKGTACTITGISARGIPAGLKNPVHIRDPLNNDWTVEGNVGATGAGLDRPNITYLPRINSIDEVEAWILARCAA